MKTLKILWAVDAFDDLPDLEKTEVAILKDLSKRAELSIDPVYVVSPIEFGLSMDFHASSTETYSLASRNAMTAKLKNIELPGLRLPQILVNFRASLRGTVDTLLTFANAKSYDLILTGSHGRRGLQRMILGSFAETLLHRSEIPVMIVGKNSKPWTEGELEILMPNDLSDPKSAFFSKVFGFARRLGAKVKLLNVIPRPLQQAYQSGVYLVSGGWVSIPVYLENERTAQQEAAKEVIREAKKYDVLCSVIIDDTSYSVTSSVNGHAENPDTSLIAMAAESGQVMSTLIGSITRQVVHSAPKPVLVFRHKG